ncbi:hypothetical protein R6G73_05715 [Actinotignum sanguinis]|uniref:hypothetical protein n=1 Tax=Actinotignum sanguinis TaxID=1445614 RepID=UPI000F7F9EC4|nr:hypothetical protein [Actinotignum sanguinis]MDY5148381.1 hypothetical protein [Actinotignum sanguinis]
MKKQSRSIFGAIVSLLLVVAVAPSAEAMYLGGYKECNAGQAVVGLRGAQRNRGIMIFTIRGEVVYQTTDYSGWVTTNYASGKWRISADDLVSKSTYATCTPIDW